MCGLNSLNRHEKLIKANEILNSTELKQAICNKILGTSFKDIEKAMLAVLNERQLTDREQEMLDLEQIAPEKFNHDFHPATERERFQDKRKPTKYGEYTREYVEYLLSQKEVICSKSMYNNYYNYQILDRAFVEKLVKEHFEYKENEKNHSK